MGGGFPGMLTQQRVARPEAVGGGPDARPCCPFLTTAVQRLVDLQIVAMNPIEWLEAAQDEAMLSVGTSLPKIGRRQPGLDQWMDGLSEPVNNSFNNSDSMSGADGIKRPNVMSRTLGINPPPSSE